MTENGKYLTIDRYIFRTHFDTIMYTGNSTVTEMKTTNTGVAKTTTIVS